MRKPKILMIEDETDVYLTNKEHFESKGYEVSYADTFANARFQLEEHAPDIILLDVLLPDGNGFDLCREIRGKSNVPIIYLTCRDENESIVKGLLEGGDDYVTKPYDLNVLEARVAAQLRRAGTLSAGRIELPPLMIDLLSGETILSGESIHLTQKELQLLACFALNAGRRLCCEQICRQAWGSNDASSKQSIAVHVTGLRKKLRLGDDSFFELRSTGKEEYLFSKIRY